jgi:ParB family protein of integrating conjugative element (PFGI_1 class)
MSTGKRLSPEQVLGNLVEGHFGRSRDLPATDPIMPTPMLLDIGEIRPYDRNPRREANERYDDIKASIRARGLDSPLRITRKPEAHFFMVAAGGNTRLRALKELFAETGDERFRQVHCLFTPWQSESDCLAAHLAENELRSDLVLIDKALALKELKGLLDEEQGEVLAQRAFHRQLESLGYRISLRQLRRYEYAVEQLHPVLPVALRAGMGGRQVDQIRETYAAYQQVHRELGEAGKSVPPFEPLWEDVLARHDATDFDLSIMRKALDGILAERAGLKVNALRNRVDAVLYEQPKVLEDVEGQSESRPQGAISFPPPMREASKKAPVPGSSSDPLGADGAGATQRIKQDPTPTAQSTLAPRIIPELPATAVTSHETVSPDDRQFADPALSSAIDDKSASRPRLDDLKSWRARCAVQAQRFAQHIDLGRCILPVQEGLGFRVEVPAKPPVDELTWAGWWLLFALSEEALIQPRIDLLPKMMELVDLLSSECHTALHERVRKPPALLNLGFQLLSSPRLSDSAFRSLLLLIESCRTLKSHFRESDLWACPTIEQFLQTPP